MINEQGFVDLAIDCSHLCEVLVAGTRGRTLDCLSPPVKRAIEDLHR